MPPATPTRTATPTGPAEPEGPADATGAPIPLANPLFGPEEEAAVAEVVRSGRLSAGPKVKAFEDAFAAAAGVRHAVAMVNGTYALSSVLRVMGVGPGDEVVVPAMTFVATANAVLDAGAVPVFADILPGTRVLDPERARAAITPRTKLLMPVHLHGHVAPMRELRELAEDKGLMLVGDAAQAHGGSLHGKPVGSLGDAETFSFYATKNMTTGEGGLVTTDRPDVADGVRSFINHGRPTGDETSDPEAGAYDHLRFGINARMTELQAALGLAQLPKLAAWNEKRRRHAAALTKALEGLPLTLPGEAEGVRHVYHQYVVETPQRAALVAALDAARIGHGIHYPHALPDYPHLRGYARDDVPVARRLAQEGLSLPIHPSLTDADLARITAAVRRGLS